MQRQDYVVIGGGVAGLAAAYELSRVSAVVLIERETMPGYHSTGRSAAVISENYGPLGWQALVSASRPFLQSPPAGFADHPLLHRIGALYLAKKSEEAELAASSRALSQRGVEHLVFSADEACAFCPVIRSDDFSTALLEPGCADIDVHVLLQGYLRAGKANGLRVLPSTEAVSIQRRGGRWHVTTAGVSLTANSVVNAAGAWADNVATRAGIQPKGLQPYRRTAITFDAPASSEVRKWPMTFDLAESWYFKPEAGRIMASPADKTPTEPCDAAPDEFDIALAVDRIEQATTMTVAKVHSKWAGLRTFAADEQPLIGPDPDEPSFLWLAGQGGNGMMGAPAAAQLLAAIATGTNPPGFVTQYGVDVAALSPARFSRSKPSCDR
jgi:D-arginine dehydrogenase